MNDRKMSDGCDGWNHPICKSCWDKREPGRQPESIEPVQAKCSLCGEETVTGIFIKHYTPQSFEKSVEVLKDLGERAEYLRNGGK